MYARKNVQMSDGFYGIIFRAIAQLNLSEKRKKWIRQMSQKMHGDSILHLEMHFKFISLKSKALKRQRSKLFAK